MQVAVYWDTNGYGKNDSTTDGNEDNVDSLEWRRRLDESHAVVVVLLLGILAFADTERVAVLRDLVRGVDITDLAVASALTIGGGGVPAVAVIGAVLTSPEDVVLSGAYGDVPSVVERVTDYYASVDNGENELVDVVVVDACDAVVILSDSGRSAPTSQDTVSSELSGRRDTDTDNLSISGNSGGIDLVDSKWVATTDLVELLRTGRNRGTVQGWGLA